MEIERTGRLIKKLTGLIGIIGGLLAAVAAFNKQLRDAFDVFASLGVVGLVTVAIVLFLLGAVLFVSARRRASRLMDPDALRLSSRNPDHLMGRSEDTRLLREKCEARPLTFLVGDSGTGKTALVQAGLIPAASGEARQLPIYIDMSNLDWELGPLKALGDHFWRSLSIEERKKLDLEKPPAKESMQSVLTGCYATLGKTPLIILDQLDHYQLRHRERFLPPETRSWLSPNELVSKNRFWAFLAELLASGNVHALLVTRSDNADGLESLRLAPEPLVIRLDPLPAGFALRIIDQLTQRPTGAAAVVEAPSQGWDRLRVRLGDDLEESGSVLPQQLKLVLLGLARLKALSIVRYERAGCMEGLEARYIEDALTRAATLAGVPVVTLRAAVLRLVDRDGLRRGAPLSTAELAGQIAGRHAEKIAIALHALEDADILCRRITDNTTEWQLDHDYLARGILQVEANADRWKSLLARRAREFENARGSWRARRKAMLSLREQIKLLVARCCGLFQYGPHRGFALLCTLPYAAYAVVGMGLFVIADTAIEISKVELTIAANPQWGYMTSAEYHALEEVAEMGDIGRGWFASRLITDPTLALRTATKSDAFVRAIVGLDSDWAGHVVDWIIWPDIGIANNETRVAADLLVQMPPAVRARLKLIAPLMDETSDDALPLRERIVQAVAKFEFEDAVKKKADSLLVRLQETRGKVGGSADNARILMSDAFFTLSEQLPPEKLQGVLEVIHSELQANHGNAAAVESLAMLYAMLSNRFPQSVKVQVLANLVEEVSAHRGNGAALQSLSWSVQVAARNLPVEQRAVLAPILLEEIRAAQGDANTFISLVFALCSVAPLSPSERLLAASVVKEEIDRSVGGGPIVYWLSEGHAVLTLPIREAQGAREEVYQSVRNDVAASWAELGQLPDGGLTTRSMYEPCWASECFAQFANLILDAARLRPFEYRARLVTELLKVPIAARLQLTEALLARLRADSDAEGAHFRGRDLWEFAVWAEENGLDPDEPLDSDFLFAALPQ